jgi:hypothetical protein
MPGAAHAGAAGAAQAGCCGQQVCTGTCRHTVRGTQHVFVSITCRGTQRTFVTIFVTQTLRQVV